MSHDNYSLSARVYNHIRDGILAGTFAKGDELKERISVMSLSEQDSREGGTASA